MFFDIALVFEGFPLDFRLTVFSACAAFVCLLISQLPQLLRGEEMLTYWDP